MSEASEIDRAVEEVKRKRRLVRIAHSRVLENIARYDPDLAEELASSPEDLETLIAEEIVTWRRVKNAALRKMKLEQLMAAFDFWKDIMKLCLGFIAEFNAVFFATFLQNYAQIANAVRARLPEDWMSKYVDKMFKYVDKTFERIERLNEMLGGERDEQGEEKVESRGDKKRKATASAGG